jgi:hypothetical protein
MLKDTTGDNLLYVVVLWQASNIFYILPFAVI